MPLFVFIINVLIFESKASIDIYIERDIMCIHIYKKIQHIYRHYIYAYGRQESSERTCSLLKIYQILNTALRHSKC